MDRELLLLYTMTAFTGVAAISLVVMACMVFGMYRSSKLMRERITSFLDKLEPLADSARQTLDETRKQTKDILVDVKELTAAGRKQMASVESLLEDLSQTARLLAERVDGGVELTLRRVNETTEILQKTILEPIRHVRGVVSAVTAVLEHLSGASRRPTPDRATSDEEMFI
jgi:ABC-type transporter Mla subunit MlaD